MERLKCPYCNHIFWVMDTYPMDKEIECSQCGVTLMRKEYTVL